LVGVLVVIRRGGRRVGGGVRIHGEKRAYVGKEVGLGRERGMTVEADVCCGGEEGVVGRVMCIEGNIVKEDA